MDLRGKIVHPKFIYIDGEFREGLALKINSTGVIEGIVEASNLPTGPQTIVFENEVGTPKKR